MYPMSNYLILASMIPADKCVKMEQASFGKIKASWYFVLVTYMCIHVPSNHLMSML